MAKVKFKDLTKKEQLEKRKEAYRRWFLSYETTDEDRMHQVEANIARNIGMTYKELLELKKKDKWQQRLEKDVDKEVLKKEIKKNLADNVPITNKEAITDINQLLDESNIPERWKIFVMYYLHSYNVTYAAKKAGYTTGANCSAGFQALQDKRVKKLMRQIKDIMYTDIWVTGRDVLQEYVKIAFADMTEYVEFDSRRVKLKSSSEVDGRLITEVRQGKDGVTIKLADKLKAMDKLDKLFDLIPDKKLELDKERFAFTKQLAEKESGDGTNKVIIINDL